MKRILLLASLFLFQPFAFSQWFWESPKPCGNDLNDVSFFGTSFGIAVGSYGTIVKTTDGGLEWTLISTGLINELNGVSLFSPTDGIVVGSSGVILKTTDGGDSWFPVSSGTTLSLNAVCFLNESYGTAVGDDGTILRSSDGGDSWVSQASGTSVDLSAVSLADGSTAFITGGGIHYPYNANGVILKTTNGGTSWAVLYSGYVSYYDVSFVNSTTGWAAGYGPVVRKTTDGGLSWITQDCGENYELYGLKFANENRGCAVGLEGAFTTTDGGNSWQHTSVSSDLESVSFADSLTTMIAGPAGNLVRSSDGGASWTRVTRGTTNSLYGISFVDENLGMAAGGFYAYAGGIYKTTNGGHDWSVMLSGVEGLSKIDYIDSSTASTVGYFGAIFRTTDGGDNWIRQTTGISNNLTDIFFINVNRGFAVGEFGTFLSTTDGGETWNHQTLTGYHLEGIHFLNSSRGYVVGQEGTILKTTNGGSSWTTLTSGTTQLLWDVYFFDMNRGIAVGQFGTYLSTTDGGNTWTSRSLGVIQLLLRINFYDENNGAIVGTSGLMLRTTNGGDDWILQDTPMNRHLNDVCFISPDKIKAVGLGGTIIATDNGGFVPVELASFTGIANGDGVTLSWLTKTETNNKGFDVERQNGISTGQSGEGTGSVNNGWQRVGFVQGSGTTTKPVSYSFRDNNITAGRYEYRLKQIDYDGSFNYSKVVTVDVSKPGDFYLSQNFPDPFNPATNIKYSLPEDADVSLKLYDILGNEVMVMVNGRKKAGDYLVRVDLSGMASGVYIFRLTAGRFTAAKKMVLVR